MARSRTTPIGRPGLRGTTTMQLVVVALMAATAIFFSTTWLFLESTAPALAEQEADALEQFVRVVDEPPRPSILAAMSTGRKQRLLAQWREQRRRRPRRRVHEGGDEPLGVDEEGSEKEEEEEEEAELLADVVAFLEQRAEAEEEAEEQEEEEDEDGEEEDEDGGEEDQVPFGEPYPSHVREETADAEAPTSPTDLAILTQLLEQYRVDFLTHGQKRQLKLEDDPYYLEAFREKITAWQAKPDVVAFADSVADRVQANLRARQSNCSRTLACNLNKNCGFGCQLHHVVHCLTNAVATDRAMVLKVSPWTYTKNYTQHFKLPTQCTQPPPPPVNSKRRRYQRRLPLEQQQDVPHAFMDIIDNGCTPYDPPFVPPDVLSEVRKFSMQPDVWWIGQLLRYVLDLADPGVITYPPQAYAAVHVRRTDKIGSEAEKHALEEYMRHVRHANVYLATDEPEVVAVASRLYPNHTFFSNVVGAEQAKYARYTDASLAGIIQDVFALAHADFLVGTFSSQISRLAFELAHALRVDAPSKTVSIDSGYYFGGWQPSVRCLVEDHAGFPAGHVIRNDGEVVPKVGYIYDKADANRTLFPLHLTRECSPGYPPMFETRFYPPEEPDDEPGKDVPAKDKKWEGIGRAEQPKEPGQVEHVEENRDGGEAFDTAMDVLELKGVKGWDEKFEDWDMEGWEEFEGFEEEEEEFAAAMEEIEEGWEEEAVKQQEGEEAEEDDDDGL